MTQRKDRSWYRITIRYVDAGSVLFGFNTRWAYNADDAWEMAERAFAVPDYATIDKVEWLEHVT
jgi:hypothetical protein